MEILWIAVWILGWLLGEEALRRARLTETAARFRKELDVAVSDALKILREAPAFVPVEVRGQLRRRLVEGPLAPAAGGADPEARIRLQDVWEVLSQSRSREYLIGALQRLGGGSTISKKDGAWYAWGYAGIVLIVGLLANVIDELILEHPLWILVGLATLAMLFFRPDLLLRAQLRPTGEFLVVVVVICFFAAAGNVGLAALEGKLFDQGPRLFDPLYRVADSEPTDEESKLQECNEFMKERPAEDLVALAERSSFAWVRELAIEAEYPGTLWKVLEEWCAE